MRAEDTMCPILTGCYGISRTEREYIEVPCVPERCMWAMRKTAKGDDGRFHTVGYRCAVATGSDRYVDKGDAGEDD